jgi:hypothetical protein
VRSIWDRSGPDRGSRKVRVDGENDVGRGAVFKEVAFHKMRAGRSPGLTISVAWFPSGESTHFRCCIHGAHLPLIETASQNVTRGPIALAPPDASTTVPDRRERGTPPHPRDLRFTLTRHRAGVGGHSGGGRFWVASASGPTKAPRGSGRVLACLSVRLIRPDQPGASLR